MGYRGQDLDVRTPQTWRAQPADLVGGKPVNGPRTRSYPVGEATPIWVDDTVLACTNHAYDVALAHRAGEVRVEHLIHALTRIDDASEILEASGIRVAALRREMATVIASEIPVGLANGSGSPRSSEAFETILRLASDRAEHTGAPASVSDLLHVMLELRPAGGGAEFIEHHMVRGARERSMQYRRPAPAPVYDAPEPQRERVRRPAGRYFVGETQTEPAPQTATDYVQNNRIDALEQMMRAISLQLTSQRDDAGRLTGGVIDRLQSLETMFSARPQQNLDVLDVVMRRLDDLEQNLRDREASLDLSPVTGRLEQLEQSVRMLSPGDFSAITSRLDQIEWKLGAVPPLPDFSPVLFRMDQLDNLVRQSQPIVNVDLSAIDSRVGDVERNLGYTLSQSIAGLDSKIDSRLDLGTISSRLDIIEEALLGRDGIMSSDFDSRLNGLSEAVSLQQTTIEDSRSSLTADVRDVAASLAEQSARIARTGEGIAELVRIVEAERSDDASALAAMGERVELLRTSIEDMTVRLEAEQQSQRQEISTYSQSVDAQATRANDALALHHAELKEVHEALMKLNANQHTLAESIDQWRSDAAGDLSVLASRIESMEREAGKPMALLATLSGNMEQMHKLTVERYHRRNRFWYWLFGTDDWVAASWPSQAERIEAERRAIARPAKR
ncbi:MAG: hypothetical protein JNM89_10895 [Hyphomicrobiaceae bacterium]|nr:hypothetical protein [Hyphomicrobiaceae bacterium]